MSGYTAVQIEESTHQYSFQLSGLSDVDESVIRFAALLTATNQSILGIAWMIAHLAEPSNDVATVFATMIAMSFAVMFIGIWLGYSAAGLPAPRLYNVTALGSGVFLFLMFCLSMFPSPVQIPLFTCCLTVVFLATVMGHFIASEILA